MLKLIYPLLRSNTKLTTVSTLCITGKLEWVEFGKGITSMIFDIFNILIRINIFHFHNEIIKSNNFFCLLQHKTVNCWFEKLHF